MQVTPARRGTPSPLLIALGGMMALASALGIGRFVYTPILPAMAGSLGWGPGTAGLLASANFAGYLAGAVTATASALPGGRRAWFGVSLALGAATTVAMGLVGTDMTAFLVLRFVGGATGAFVLVLGTAAVLDMLAEQGRSGLGALHYAGVGVGIALSALAVAGLEAGGADWRMLWLVAGAIAAGLIVLPIAVLRWPPRRQGPASPAVALGRAILPLSICHFLFGFGYAVTATFLIAMARAAPETRAIEPVIWVAVGLTAAPSLLLWLAVSARIGARRAYAAASVLEAAGVLLAGGWPSSVGLLVGAALLGITFMGLTALGFAVAREAGAVGQERRFAVVTIGFSLGQALGPALGGGLAQATGSYWGASALAAGALLIAAVAIVATRPRPEVTEPTSLGC